MKALPERVLAKISFCPTTGCWLWTGHTDKGYGQVHINRKVQLAHRFIYQVIKGPFDTRLDLDHLCRTPSCVNPDHLEPVSHRENMARGLSSAAHALRTDKCKRGHSTWGKHANGGRYCRTCQNARSNGLNLEAL